MGDREDGILEERIANMQRAIDDMSKVLHHRVDDRETDIKAVELSVSKLKTFIDGIISPATMWKLASITWAFFSGFAYMMFGFYSDLEATLHTLETTTLTHNTDSRRWKDKIEGNCDKISNNADAITAISLIQNRQFVNTINKEHYDK